LGIVLKLSQKLLSVSKIEDFSLGEIDISGNRFPCPSTSLTLLIERISCLEAVEAVVLVLDINKRNKTLDKVS